MYTHTRNGADFQRENIFVNEWDQGVKEIFVRVCILDISTPYTRNEHIC